MLKNVAKLNGKSSRIINDPLHDVTDPMLSVMIFTDLVVVIASNDAWVMSAWGKVNGVNGDSKCPFIISSRSTLVSFHVHGGVV